MKRLSVMIVSVSALTLLLTGCGNTPGKAVGAVGHTGATIPLEEDVHNLMAAELETTTAKPQQRKSENIFFTPTVHKLKYTFIQTKEEHQFFSETASIYLQAFREACAEMKSSQPTLSVETSVDIRA